MKKILLLCSLMMAFSGFAKIATDFSLMGEDGKEHSLSEYKGKLVVLEWTNKDCPFVKKHYNSNNMQAMQKEYTDKGVIWLSIISSAPGKQGHIQSFQAADHKKNQQPSATHLLLDPTGKVGKLYGATATPHMFIINKKGDIAYSGGVDSISSYDAEDVPKAKNFVKLALNSLLKDEEVKISSTQAYGCSVKY